MPTLAEILEEEKRRKEEQKDAEPDRPVALTRQALYGDLIEEEQQIKSEVADPFGFIEEEMGRMQPTQPRMEALEEEKQRRFEREVEKVGGEVATTTEGKRVMIPKPETADDPLAVMGARALSETARGVATLFGEEEAIPQVRDESDLVNIGSEALQLMGGATTGALAGAKLFGKVLKNSPKAAQWMAGIVGAPAGEFLVATEETGTLQGEEGDTAMDRKLQVLMEGMGLGTTLGLGSWAVGKVADLSAVSRLVKAVPVALMGTREGAEKAAGETIADLIARAEGAKTAEERVAALQRIQDSIAENFEKQTGVNFQRYMDGEVDLPEGVTFKPTTGGTADSELMAAIERGVAQREGMPEFRGRFESQRRAMEEGIEQTAQEALPEAARSAVRQGEVTTGEAAERLGSEAREDIGRVVAGRVQAAREELVEPFEDTLQRAQREVDLQFEEGAEATFAGIDRTRTNRQGANNAAQEATDLVQEAYLSGRSTKSDLYDEYGDEIADVEVPATQFEKDLMGMIDENQIANISSIVAAGDPKYRTVLQQLANQRQRLTNVINKQVSENAKRLQDNALKAKVDAGVDSPSLTAAERKAIDDEAMSMLDMDAALKEADFRDVKLQDIEGLLQYVNSIKNSQDSAVRGGMSLLATGLENIITRTLGEGSEALAKRNQAIEYFQNFNDLYKTATGGEIVPNFRFGDKITNQQLAQARDGVTTVLRNARDKNAPLEFLQELRAGMDDEARAAFDLATQKFYKQDIYSKVRLDPTSQAARDNPARAAQLMASQFKRVLSDYPNLDKLSPKVVEDVNALVRKLESAGNNAADARKALDDAQTNFDALKKEVENTPEAKFARDVADTDSVQAVKGLLTDPNKQKTFERIWNTAGEAGEKGADNLTDAQRKLKATVAQGALELIYPAAARGKDTGELSFAAIEKSLNENRTFQLVFPEGDPGREMFDTLVERARAVSKRDVRATSGESATASIQDVGTLVSEFINYVQGPLSKEGRRSKMLSRVFFKLAGGPEQGAQVMTDLMLDPRVAFRVLEDAKQRMAQTGVSFDEAKAASAGTYILARLGVNSLDEFNSEVESMTLATQTEEAFGN